MLFGVLSGMCSGFFLAYVLTLSLAGIPTDMCFAILPGTYADILSGMLSDIYSGILPGVLSVIYYDISICSNLSGILAGMCSGPGVPSCIQSSPKLADEARRRRRWRRRRGREEGIALWLGLHLC